MQMFGGWNKKYKHASDTLGCSMTFTVYYPPAAEKSKVPVGFDARAQRSILQSTFFNIIQDYFEEHRMPSKKIHIFPLACLVFCFQFHCI